MDRFFVNLLADRKAVDSTTKYSLLAWDKNQAFKPLIFKYLSINWGKFVFHLNKWNFELIGYSEHITNYLAYVKALLTYMWRWLGKRSSSSFYSSCGDRGLKQTRKFFLSKCPCIFCTRPNWRKEVLFGRGRQEWCKAILPQIVFSFNETKFLLLCNLNNTTFSFAVF